LNAKMTIFDEPRRGQECDSDLLWSVASIESTLAGLRAEQFEYLDEFLRRFSTDEGVRALAGRERMITYGGAGTPRSLSSPWSRCRLR